MIKLVPVLVCALVPAYLYQFSHFFSIFPEEKRSFFDKKNVVSGPLN
jgi:hypothetical protein